MRRELCAALVLAALLGGCSSDPAAETPLTTVAQGQGFVLAVALPTDHFTSGQAIDVRTTLTWTGPAPNVTIWGSGMGPVGFLFEELTGRQRKIGGVMTADCSQHSYVRGVATPIPLGKSAAWTAADPDAAFFQAFAKDPLLHLPAGRWRITAELSGYLAECAMDAPGVSLKAVLEIGVG